VSLITSERHLFAPEISSPPPYQWCLPTITRHRLIHSYSGNTNPRTDPAPNPSPSPSPPVRAARGRSRSRGRPRRGSRTPPSRSPPSRSPPAGPSASSSSSPVCPPIDPAGSSPSGPPIGRPRLLNRNIIQPMHLHGAYVQERQLHPRKRKSSPNLSDKRSKLSRLNRYPIYNPVTKNWKDQKARTYKNFVKTENLRDFKCCESCCLNYCDQATLDFKRAEYEKTEDKSLRSMILREHITDIDEPRKRNSKHSSRSTWNIKGTPVCVKAIWAPYHISKYLSNKAVSDKKLHQKPAPRQGKSGRRELDGKQSKITKSEVVVAMHSNLHFLENLRFFSVFHQLVRNMLKIFLFSKKPHNYLDQKSCAKTTTLKPSRK